MEFGIQMHPSHKPGTDPRRAVEWDLQVLKWADEYGFSEAWIGEHFTIGWEANPAPELLIAQAARETKRIRLCAGAHLLPYHNPVALALRLAYLDHMTGGRYTFGVGAGAHAIDAQLFATNGKNPEMMAEALEIITRIWTAEGPFKYKGEFFSVDYPAWDDDYAGPWLKPLQKPHPPIAMAGLSPKSPSLRKAGEMGLIPLSLNLSPNYLSGHWDAYKEGAASTGQKISRKNWRVGREFFVAETDKEAFNHAVGPYMGDAQRQFLLKLFKKFNMMKHLCPDPNVPESDITPEYLAKNVWLVGSPETVARKLRSHFEEAGGFGVTVGVVFDHSGDSEPLRRSLELMGREVLPRVKDLVVKD
jgi:alkanesulfonate monooxygenase SsuD/methylene tetrahydromethanopterin reductase-like flavin-dependent oxidoreductase (luciferase family)